MTQGTTRRARRSRQGSAATSRSRYRRHGRRAGQSASLRSGVIAATTPVIATSDGGGQNAPAEIMRVPRLGRDGREPVLVGGLRKGRKAKGLHKSASRFAKWIRDRGCPDTRCGLKVYRREDHLTLPHFSMHRYLPALFLIYGHEIAYEPVNDRLQLKGASKYTNPGRALIGLYNLGPARRPPASQVKVGRRRNDVGTIRDLVGVDANSSGLPSASLPNSCSRCASS